MTPNRNASKDLSEQVGAKRPKPYHKDDPLNILHSRYKQSIFVVNTGSASYSGSVLMPAASVHVSLNELADIMIVKMLQPGLIFAPTPTRSETGSWTL